jgi:hypothetical protein
MAAGGRVSLNPPASRSPINGLWAAVGAEGLLDVPGVGDRVVGLLEGLEALRGFTRL